MAGVECEESNPKTKRALSSDVESHEPNKEIKRFSVSHFRNNLRCANKATALEEFLRLIQNNNKKHSIILEYLDNGGSCLELLQVLEVDSSISPTLVFDIITYILLKISICSPHYQSGANDACRYLLNNYITVINKMLGLSSTTAERKSCLKLLTAIVTISSFLAKDVLLNVNFHTTNIELLTKHTGEKNSVRDHFIHFLTSFFVDGHYPALSVLLEKKGFITSIISGLQYDDADSLCIVISAMRKFILENPSISKTSKMKTFNTMVVKEIVNLYNWKGPSGQKIKGSKNIDLNVNHLDKTKVNEAVHEFLLVLCTSHKYGVIFKDNLVGLGKKNQNPLLYTILECLDRPWDHSYASELVIKICAACPDLAKTVWNNLKPFLEPRDTPKWINAVNFAKKLIQHLQPSCIEYCSRELNTYQMFQVIQCLVAPAPIIKVFSSGDSNSNRSVKEHVTSLYLEMLKALDVYLKYVKNFFTLSNYEKLHTSIQSHVKNHFPNVYDELRILEDSKNINTEDTVQLQRHIEMIFDVLDSYKQLSPPLLLDNMDSIDIFNVINRIKNLFIGDLVNLPKILMKAVRVFIDLDQTKFSVKSDLFTLIIFPLLFKYYYESKSQEALNILNKLLSNTGIFDGCEYEINIWINGILNLKHYDPEVIEVIIKVLRTIDDNNNSLDDLDRLSKTSVDSNVKNINKTIDNLKNIDVHHHKHFFIKNRFPSPMILGLFTTLQNRKITKHMKMYVDFVIMNLIHLQTDLNVIGNILNEHDDIFETELKYYVLCWQRCTEELCVLKKSKCNLKIFAEYSKVFLGGDIMELLNATDLTIYTDLPLNLLTMSLFYLRNMVNNNNALTQIVIDNCEKYITLSIQKRFVNDAFLEILLCHPVLIQNVSFTSLPNGDDSRSSLTKFLIKLIKILLNNGIEIEKYLIVYQQKLSNTIFKILKHPKKYENLTNFSELLQIFKIDSNVCREIIAYFSKNFNISKNICSVVLEILIYSLNNITINSQNNDTRVPIDSEQLQCLISYFILCNETADFDIANFCNALSEYLETFPHHFKNLSKDFFVSLLKTSKLTVEIIRMTKLILVSNAEHMNWIEEHLDLICEKKTLLFPIIEVLVDNKENIYDKIYEKIENTLTKALQKPQKAGQYFHHYFEGIKVLIEKCMPLKNCQVYIQKVQKFEVSEIFHASLLGTIYKKCVENLTDLTDKQLYNIILTFIHLQVNLLKRNLKNENDETKLSHIATVFNEILLILLLKSGPCLDLKNIAANETMKIFYKFCLKYGVAGNIILLKTLNNLLRLLARHSQMEDAQTLMDMLVSHSEFIDRMIGEHCETKLEILTLFKTLCETWETLMDKSHVPLLLASYKAMVNKWDRTILLILQRFEAKAEQTQFFNYKPFLWGSAAATHYSVRYSIDKALLRQPKTGDILDILQDDLIRSTILNYPLVENLYMDDEEFLNIKDVKSYDIMFLLPLFSQLLAPEQQVQTYKFTRSGALSLTIVALGSHKEDVRKAACHVLSRFFFHLEAKHSGKDNLLWIRYIEAVCKGTAILPNFKLNTFSAIYLAKMSMILTQPNHVMYVPLSQHLTAKSSLDFASIPELYTFLHSSDVNYKEHRNFILELMKDGLRTEKDFTYLERSMAFKLFMELYSSCLCDWETKMLILNIIKAACTLTIGVKMLCENHSLLTIIYNEVHRIKNSDSRNDKYEQCILEKIIGILSGIKAVLQNCHFSFMIITILKQILNLRYFNKLNEKTRSLFFETFYSIYSKSPELFDKSDIENLLTISKDSYSKYLYEYNCGNEIKINLDEKNEFYYLRLLIIKHRS